MGPEVVWTQKRREKSLLTSVDPVSPFHCCPGWQMVVIFHIEFSSITVEVLPDAVFFNFSDRRTGQNEWESYLHNYPVYTDRRFTYSEKKTKRRGICYSIKWVKQLTCRIYSQFRLRLRRCPSWHIYRGFSFRRMSIVKAEKPRIVYRMRKICDWSESLRGLNCVVTRIDPKCHQSISFKNCRT